jgi:ParB-like chromosome segregation protein Spo0J
MSTRIRHIPLDRLVPHPDHPNRMSRTNFRRLLGHIERTGQYEPLVVRPCPGRSGFFQILNGRYRCEALRTLGRRTADAVVWEVDDEQADVLLATLNRLHGHDALEERLALLRRLHERRPARQLARLLPQTPGQIERLASPRLLPRRKPPRADAFAIPLVFFVDERQQRTIEEALSALMASSPAGTRAAGRAAALAHLARVFLRREPDRGPGDRPKKEPAFSDVAP